MRTFLCSVMLVAIVGTARAGQMASHEYTAIAATQWLTGRAREIVEENMDAYLSGAQGPDTTGIVMHNLHLVPGASPVGEESHYSDRKAELAVSILDAAEIDEDKAYALGWLSHYVNDYFIHPVVNDYGGFYGTDQKHHKELEQLETKHVFTAHGDVVTREMSEKLPSALRIGFGGFLFDGYHATFPNDSRYQTGTERLGNNKGYFRRCFVGASEWSLAASRDFYLAHDNGTGKHGWLPSWTESSAVWKLFPPMPSTKEYEALLHPLEIAEVKPMGDRIEVKAKVADSKHYGRFVVDWEEAALAAQELAGRVLPLACDYLEAKDAKLKAELRGRLLAVVPNVNLDQPRAAFDPAAVVPGSADCERLTYELTLIPESGPDGTPVLVTGQSTPIVYGKDVGFAGGRSGEVTFQITLPKPVAAYRFTLKVGMTDAASFKRPEYLDVDWRQVEGTSAGLAPAGPGNVAVGVPFPVHIPLPSDIGSLQGDRLFVVMKKGHAMTLRDMMALRDDSASEDLYRTDVRMLGEKVSASAIDATLQVWRVDADEEALLGETELVMLWYAPGRAKAERGSPFDRLVAAGKVTKAQVAALTAALSTYAGSLKTGTSRQQDALIDLKMRTEMAKLGLGPEDLTGVRYSASVPMTLHATRLGATLPPGWAPLDARSAFARFAKLTRGATHPTSEKMWSIDGHARIAVGTKPEYVRTGDYEDADPPSAPPPGTALSGYQMAFAAAHAGETGRPMTVGCFTGIRYETTNRRTDAGPIALDVEVAGAALLRCGSLYLELVYVLDAEGRRLTTWNDGRDVVLYDGTGDADRALAAARANLQSLWKSIRLERVGR